MKFEAPRGTHDILPAEQPLWRLVLGEAERLCALYGYRRDPDARLRGHGALRPHVRRGLRRRAEGDVHLRRPRRPLADAAPRGDRADLPRVRRARPPPRAAAAEALHDRADVPLRRAAEAGRYREHWQLSVEAIGSDDPAIDAEVIQLYDDAAARGSASTSYRLELNSIGDRELPARLPRAADRVARRARRRARRGRARRSGRRARCASSTSKKPERVQAALADAPKIGESLCDECREHFDAVRALPRRVRRRVRARADARARPRLLHAHDLRVRRRGARRAELDSAGGGRYDGLIEEIGGPPTPGVGFGAGIERLAARARGAAASTAASPTIDVFFALEDGRRRARRCSRWMAELRARGVALPTPTTPAARSRAS